MRRRKFGLLTLALSGILLVGATSCTTVEQPPKPDTQVPGGDTEKPKPEPQPNPDPKPEPQPEPQPEPTPTPSDKANFTGHINFGGSAYKCKVVLVDDTNCKLEFEQLGHMLNQKGTYKLENNVYTFTFTDVKGGKQTGSSTYDEATKTYTINMKYQGPEATCDLVLTWKKGEATTPSTPDTSNLPHFTGKMVFMGEFTVTLILNEGGKCTIDFGKGNEWLNAQAGYKWANNVFTLTYNAKEYKSTFDAATGIHTLKFDYKGPNSTVPVTLTWNTKA